MSHDSFPDSGHDHRACVQGALRDAETLCARRGVRLTPARRRVLELIWQSHRPSGAYDLLERLAADGHRPSPPTVYRALDFLLRQGLVHRVSSRNAFVGCNHPGDDHMAQLFICDRCDVAFEQARLVGDWRLGALFDPLAAWLVRERDPVVAFHVARSLAPASSKAASRCTATATAPTTWPT